MRTLYIVGVDFQLRFGIHPAIAASQQIAVALVGFGFLCAFCHNNPSAENADRFIIQYVFEQFVATTVWNQMVNQSMVVNLLAPVGDSHSVEVCFGVFAG